MSRRRNKNNSVLHSGERHRNRNYKRRIRNLFLEISFIIFLIFVSKKIIKKEEDKPTIQAISTEEQQQIIDDQMQETESNNNDTIELKVPESEKGVVIVKATLKYVENDNQTIINIDVKNYEEKIEGTVILISLIDENGKSIEDATVNIGELDKDQQTRVNIVLENDLSSAKEIKIIEVN